MEEYDEKKINTEKEENPERTAAYGTGEPVESRPAECPAEEKTSAAKKKYPADKRLKIFQLPVPGYILFFVIEAIAITVLGSIIGSFLPENISGFGTAAAALLMLLVNRLYCLPHYRGMLTVKRLGKGMAMGAVIFGICILLNFLSSVQLGLIRTGFLKALAMAMAAGFGEEVMLRGPGMANFMRVTDDERKIPLIFWFSSLMFGLMHLSNLRAGADVLMTVLQTVSATAGGMLFAAIYLRTGNLWPGIIYHTLIDLACFVAQSMLDSEGILTTAETLSVFDWIYLAMSIPMAIAAIRLVAKKHRGEILAVWAERWNKGQQGDSGKLSE